MLKMAVMDASHLTFVFGILGSIASFLLYLSPLPTFYRIFRKKSTEGFQAIPYSVTLFSCMLMLYYGVLKGLHDGFMIIIISTIGCAIEAIYLILFLIYAPGKVRIYTIKLLVLFNVGAYGLMLLSTSFVGNSQQRVTVVGWIGAVFCVCVFAAPLSIMRLVIKTKSVEYMPFALSFCVTLRSVTWFFYGLLIKDFFIASPNIPGFLFGIAQMILYLVFKNSRKEELPEFKLPEMPPKAVVQTSAVQDAPTMNGSIAISERNNNELIVIV